MNAAVLRMPEDRPDKPLVRKLRFIEHLTARRDLSPLELRVGIRLVSLTNSRRGVAWPTVDMIADDMAAHKRNVIRAIRRLEELGLFAVARSTGRGHASEYAPAFEILPEGCPFAAARAERVAPAPSFKGQADAGTETERVAFSSERVAFSSLKGGAVTTPSDSSSDSEFNRSVTTALSGGSERSPGPSNPSRSTGRSEQGGTPSPKASKTSQRDDDQRHFEALRGLWSHPLEISVLYRVARAIKAGFPARLSQADRITVHEQLELIAEANDDHSGDPLGGFARRLHSDFWEFVDLGEDDVPSHNPKGS